jgi:hypothetical protein
MYVYKHMYLYAPLLEAPTYIVFISSYGLH